MKKTPFKTKNRDTFRLKENVSKNYSKQEKEISKRKKCFVYNYNYDWWSNRTSPLTQSNTLQRIILDDCADEKKSIENIITFNQLEIFP